MKHCAPLLVLLIASVIACLPSQAAEPAFRFDGQDFFLKANEGGIKEYLPAGETFEDWTTLMSVRGFRNIADPQAYALRVVENARKSGPAGQGQVIRNDKGDTYIADFLVFPPQGAPRNFAEWNLMRVRKSGEGIEVLQYARRFYDFDESAAATIRAERNKIVPRLAAFEIPE